MIFRTGWVLLCLLAVGAATAEAGPQVTFEGLLRDLHDLDGLAEYPSPRFTCRQFSSYDRKSRSPGEEGWFANGDCGQYLRVEERDGRKEHVMMDAEGPGAIVRIWSANPKGTIRIYLDGAATPVLAVPMADLLGGKVPGVPVPIAGERSRGWNCYLPVPYARRCVVTSDEGGFYYHVNYRTYEAGTTVKSFAPEDLESAAERIETLGRVLRLEPGFGGTDLEHRQRLRPGESFVMGRAGQPEKVLALLAKVDAKDVPRALRALWLTISFDGEETVAAPLGDFFGAAPGLNPYRSLPMAVAEDGTMVCRWLMPYDRTARFEIRNRGDQAATVGWQVAAVWSPWTDRSMHFHAKWRAQADVPTRPMLDWNYLTVEGQGTFVGASFSIANPVKNWWGEGDEKIYVDGETFPSHFGTGTEDYYGYAWCSNQTFQHAYHGQPRCDGPGNHGHTSVYRWHILDRIPFERSFRFDMELWHWHADCRVTMSVVAYWYARPGASDGFAPIDTADLRLAEIPPYVAPRVPGAIEGESMRVIETTARVEPQEIACCSGESHMWWHDGVKVGDRMILGFPVEKAGRYRVIARFLMAKDYGIARMSVNGSLAGDPIDLYHDGIVVSEEIELGTFELTEGENRIGAEITGANKRAIKAHLFGLDYVRLVAVD